MSPSAASRRLAAIETRLGVKLAERSARRFALTDAGQRYYAGLIPLLRCLNELEESIRAAEHGFTGVLRVTAPVCIGERLMTGWLLELSERHPQLELEMIWSDVFVDLGEHGIDLAIRVGELDDSRLHARRLGELQHVLVAAPSLLDRLGGPPGQLDEIERYPVVEYTELRKPRVLRTADTERVLPFAGMVRVNHIGALLEAVLAGAGLGLCPSWLAAAEIEGGRLIRLLPNVQFQSLPVNGIYPPHRRGSARLRAILDLVGQRLEQLPVLP